jgi:hypothetical protein
MGVSVAAPKRYVERVQAMVTPAQSQAITALAKRDHVSFSEIVRRALKNHAPGR